MAQPATSDRATSTHQRALTELAGACREQDCHFCRLYEKTLEELTELKEEFKAKNITLQSTANLLAAEQDKNDNLGIMSQVGQWCQI